MDLGCHEGCVSERLYIRINFIAWVTLTLHQRLARNIAIPSNSQCKYSFKIDRNFIKFDQINETSGKSCYYILSIHQFKQYPFKPEIDAWRPWKYIFQIFGVLYKTFSYSAYPWLRIFSSFF